MFTETFFSAAAAADREHQHGVARADPRALQPAGEAGLPAFVVGARGQLGNIVGGRVGFEAAQLAKVVDRVAGVPGRAADAQDEQTSAAFAHVARGPRPCARSRLRPLFQNGDGFGDERRRESETNRRSAGSGSSVQ